MPTRNPLISLARLLLLAGVLVGLGACDVEFVGGRYIDVAALDSHLVAGQSDEDEIVAAIGEPLGWGRAMFPFHDSPRDVMAYYFERGNMEDARRTFLWVFVKDGRYDGHMWFSSLPGI